MIAPARGVIFWVLVLGAIGLVLALPRITHAQTVSNPSMTLYEAHGLQHIIAEGDILILVRYQLPKDAWRVDQGDVDATATTTAPYSAYMDQSSCFEDNTTDPTDPCWTSLLSGVASQYFYDGVNTTATLISQRTLPRVGHGLSAVYIGAGHSLTFGDTTYETCIVGSATLFSPVDSVCSTLLWHPVTDADGDGILIDDAKITTADVFTSIMSSLQGTAPGKTERLIVNAKITPEGTLYLREAYTNSVIAAPTAFALTIVGGTFTELTNDKTAAEISINADATGTNFYGYVEDFNQNHFDGVLSMTTIGGILVGIVGLVVFAFALMYLQNLFLSAVIAGLVIFGFGVLNSLFDYRLFIVVVLIVFSYGAFTFVRLRI